MKLSEINEYAQTVAVVLAIAGIVFVGLQVQQSNRFADADFISDFYDTQMALKSADIDSGIYATVAKSIEAPSQLTVGELLELNAYFINRLKLMEKILDAGSALGILTETARDYQLDQFRLNAKYNFPGEFGRTWVKSMPSSYWSPDSPLRAALLKGLNDPSIETLDAHLIGIRDASQR
jgi:hypothetical protein